MILSRFQSTCLREARHPACPDPDCLASFQSTCLREARRGPPGPPTVATHFNPRACVRHDRNQGHYSKCNYFNPRACVRHDLRARGGSCFGPHFNPRACVRHDLEGCPTPAGPSSFQSTCLREARQPTGTLTCRKTDFNPRACVRHDSTLYIGGQISYLPQRRSIPIISNYKHKQHRTAPRNTKTARHTTSRLRHAGVHFRNAREMLRIDKQPGFARPRTPPEKHGHFTFATPKRHHYKISTSSTFNPGFAPTCST